MKVELIAEIDERKNLEKISLIYGDQRRFLQILLNFLSNAMKFTNPGGSVSIKLSVLDEQLIEKPDDEIIQQPSEPKEEYISLQLSIIDTGIGMSTEGIQNLFIDFGRLSENEGRNKSGTGLGLSICKQIIGKMGGSVEVKSQLGLGSQFIINLKTKCKINIMEQKLDDCQNFKDFRFIFKKEGSENFENHTIQI
jgi:two-component system sensor histidine kinase/response regulator